MGYLPTKYTDFIFSVISEEFGFIGALLVTAVLLLCCVDGANTPVGLCHYAAGLAAGILGTLHMLTRARRLYGGLTAHVRTRNR